jgi:hypothetical protein
MPVDQARNRTVGCKMTDSEYERLSAVAEGDGMTLGEWVREVLLERAGGRKPSVIEETVLAETLALRTILLNAFYKLAQGEKLTTEEMQAIIDRADAGTCNLQTSQCPFPLSHSIQTTFQPILIDFFGVFALVLARFAPCFAFKHFTACGILALVSRVSVLLALRQPSRRKGHGANLRKKGYGL